MPIKVARIFNTYGRMHPNDGRVVSNFRRLEGFDPLLATVPHTVWHQDLRTLAISDRSPGCLLQNELIQRQIRDRLAQPAVLELKVLQALHLLALEPTELLTPPIIRHLAHADLADCVHHVK